MAFQGWAAGMISMLLALVFFVLLVYSIFFPGTATLSSAAVIIGVGTIVSTVVLAVFLVADK